MINLNKNDSELINYDILKIKEGLNIPIMKITAKIRYNLYNKIL